MKASRVLVPALILLLSSSAYASPHDALVLTSPPRESPQAGARLYGGLAQGLSRLLGRTVVYRQPASWLDYARDMRAGKYDLVFDGPHFAAWRMVHLGDHVLARLPGTLVFHIVARAQDADTTTLHDLIGKKVCGIAPPNLATMAMLNRFPNPARQPVIKPVKNPKAVYQALLAGDCVAGVMRTQFYARKLSDAQRAKLRILATSKPLPNQSITASTRLSPKEQHEIAQWLTSGDGVSASHPIIARFGGRAKSFVTADPAEFAGNNLLLEGVVFGW